MNLQKTKTSLICSVIFACMLLPLPAEAALGYKNPAPGRAEKTFSFCSAMSDVTLYSIRDIKELDDYYGKDYLCLSGSPGDTIGLDDYVFKYYDIIVDNNYNCPKTTILYNAWGTTKGKELVYSGTWKVPAKHNGKTVKKGYLHIRPSYKARKFDVYSKIFGSSDWIKTGSSVTKRPYCADFYTTFVYE